MSGVVAVIGDVLSSGVITSVGTESGTTRVVTAVETTFGLMVVVTKRFPGSVVTDDLVVVINLGLLVVTILETLRDGRVVVTTDDELTVFLTLTGVVFEVRFTLECVVPVITGEREDAMTDVSSKGTADELSRVMFGVTSLE